MRIDHLEGITGTVSKNLVVTEVIYPCLVISIGDVMKSALDRLETIDRVKNKGTTIPVYLKTKTLDARVMFKGYLRQDALVRYLEKCIIEGHDMDFKYIYHDSQTDKYCSKKNEVILVDYKDLRSILS